MPTLCLPRVLVRLATVLVPLTALVGCAADEGADEDDVMDENVSSAEELAGGAVTYARPEVGSIEIDLDAARYASCTATLVAPKIVVSAAHCVKWTSKAADGSRVGTFVITRRRADGTIVRSRFSIDGYTSFGHAANPSSPTNEEAVTDVALLHLGRAVSASIAKPVALATAAPPQGSPAFLYAMGNTGCTLSSSGQYDGKKRRLVLTVGASTGKLCPGDSGSPFFTSEAKIYAVVSGKDSATGRDRLGHPYAVMPGIYAQAAAWNWGQ